MLNHIGIRILCCLLLSSFLHCSSKVRFRIRLAQGTEPQGVADYPQAQTLYIYSKEPLDSLLKNPIWEIKSFMPYQKATSLQVNETISLYKLEK
jgi:hypothetical protein